MPAGCLDASRGKERSISFSGVFALVAAKLLTVGEF